MIQKIEKKKVYSSKQSGGLKSRSKLNEYKVAETLAEITALIKQLNN